ncbi:WG repeat-containing protein [Leptospira interrogans]|uniref:WG repeat-containing protein n=1 Tax=Leptospira interrogans TaxID=173 RepID=UPI0002BAF96A|nr:WG repeat-containing protein [Leptospira interrogans]
MFFSGAFADDRQVISKNGKFGVVDVAGKEIIPIKNMYVVREKEYFVVGNASNLNALSYGVKKAFASFIDIFPDMPCIALPPGGNSGCNRSSHVSRVTITTTAIFYDLDGKRIGTGEYTAKNTGPFPNNWILYLKTNGESVFVNEKGIEVLSIGGNTVADTFSENILIIEKWSGRPYLRRYGLLSLDGKIRTSIQYDSIYKYSKVDALARVSIWGTKEPNDRLYGFINIHGEEIIPPKYTFASEFSDGMAKVHKGEGSPTYIDRSGKELILDGFFTREYEEEATFNDGLLAISNDRSTANWGYVDKQGKVAIPLQFSYAGTFHDQVAIVAKRKKVGEDSKYGVIDTAGKFVIPPIYDHIEEFHSGAAIVYNDSKDRYKPKMHGLVDRTGKFLIPLIYSDLSRSPHGKNRIVATIITGQRETYYGRDDITKRCLFSDRGKLLIPCKYDFIHSKDLGEFSAKIERKDGRTSDYFYFDNNGKFLRKE